jgi:curli biogenesis system outer membrane secretion channel CsgG
MKFLKLVVMVLFSTIFLLLTGCATVNHPNVVKLSSPNPDVSKVIEFEQNYSLKRKVSIARFTNETQYGQGNLFNNNFQKVGGQAMDILSAKLTKTGKFLMFERPDIENISSDLTINITDNNNDKPVKTFSDFNILSDYIIVGSVSEFGRKNTSETGVFSRTKKQTANAKVNVRLIDVKTGQIIYAEEGSGEAFSEVGTVLGSGSQAGYDSSLNDKALDAAISKLVSNIVENLLNKPWRAYVLDVNDDEVIMSGGKSQNINVGDEFQVFKKGKLVKNPQTGFEIELPGKQIAKIKVNSFYGNTVNDEISFCSLVEGDLSGFNVTDIYIEEIQK